MTTPLQQAAQSILARWDAPASTDQLLTADHIYEQLRKALASELAQAVEPVSWMKFARKKPTVKSLSFSRELTKVEKAHGFVSTPLYLHPPQQAVVVDLVKALNAFLTHMGMDEDEFNKPTFNQARTAIAKAQGELR